MENQREEVEQRWPSDTEERVEISEDSVDKDDIGILSGFFTTNASRRSCRKLEGAWATSEPIRDQEEGRIPETQGVYGKLIAEETNGHSMINKLPSYHHVHHINPSTTYIISLQLSSPTPEDSRESSSNSEC